MTTHAIGRSSVETRVWHGLSVHWAWLAGGFVLAFAVPYVFADVVEINRDLFYGIYALSVIGLFWLWSRSTGYDLLEAVRQRWLAALLLGLAAAGALAAVVVRTEDATARPAGLDLVGALAWRGVVYGITDGRSSIGLPDPCGLRGIRGNSTQPAIRRQGSNRHRRSCCNLGG